MKIYVASSWRNKYQPDLIHLLREKGHGVYDFRNPYPGIEGFHWSEIDPEWQRWDPEQYRCGLVHPVAEDGYNFDFDAMEKADVCVLLLPCGRSAHLEAGWFVGAGRPLHILILEKCEPELMYRMATGIHISVGELLIALAER